MKKNRHIIAGAILCSNIFLLGQCVNAEELTKEDYEALADTIEEELRNGDIGSEEDIRRALNLAEEKYDLEISDSEKDKVIGIMETAEKLGIDQDKMADMVGDVYDKVINGKSYDNTEEMIDAIEDEIIDSAANTVKENVKEKVNSTFSNYFSTLLDRIRAFFARITALWQK